MAVSKKNTAKDAAAQAAAIKNIQNEASSLAEETIDIVDRTLKLERQRLEIQKELLNEEALIQDYAIKAVTARKESLKYEKEGNTILSKRKGIEADIAKTNLDMSKLAVAALKRQKKLNEFLEKQAPTLQKISDLESKIAKQREVTNDISEKALAPFKNLTGYLKNIPVLGKALEPVLSSVEDKFKTMLSDKIHSKSFKKINEEVSTLKDNLKSAAEKSGIDDIESVLGNSESSLSTMASDAKGLSGSFGSVLTKLGPMSLGIGAVVAAVGFLAKKFTEVLDAQVDIVREQSLSRVEAAKFAKNIASAQLSATKYGIAMATATDEMLKAQTTFSNSLETSNRLMEVNIQMSGYLQKNMVLSAEEANEFLQATALSGLEMDRNVLLVDSLTKSFNKLTGAGFRTRDVVKEIGKLSATTLANYRNSTAEITKGILYLKQFGLTFADAEKSAASILDIESSINAEFEASVLTGKHINLNQARYLALMGDTQGAMKSMVEQIGSYEEIESMLPIQREKLASAIGMSADQLLKSLSRQKVLNALGEDEVKILSNLTDEELKRAEAAATGARKEAISSLLADKASIKASELTASAMGKMSVWLDKQLGMVSGAALEAEKEAIYGTAVKAQDTLIRPGQAPVLFDKNDLIVAGTGLFNNTPSNNSNSELVVLLKQLIAKVDQPVQIVMGGKVIDELDNRITLRKTYTTKVDSGYGVFG